MELIFTSFPPINQRPCLSHSTSTRVRTHVPTLLRIRSFIWYWSGTTPARYTPEQENEGRERRGRRRAQVWTRVPIDGTIRNQDVYIVISMQRKAPGTSLRVHKRVAALQGGTGDGRARASVGVLHLPAGVILNRASPYEGFLLYLVGQEKPRIPMRIQIS